MRPSGRCSRCLRLSAFGALLGAALAAAPAAAVASPVTDLVPLVAGSTLFDNGTGFTWGTSDGSFAIARTRDSGRTWSRLDLAGIPIETAAATDSAGGSPGPVDVHFADPDHGWCVWSESFSVLHIANTADGGTSWQNALSLETDVVLNRAVFPGPGRACLLAQMAEGMMHTTLVTLATNDNGVTWTSSSLGGDGVSDWAFRTATEGFLSIIDPAGADIFFYRTADGGKTWARMPLALPPGVSIEEVDGTTPGKPVFSGPQDLAGRLPVRLHLAEGTRDVLYRTVDGGKTWRYAE